MAPLRAEDLAIGAKCLYKDSHGSLQEVEIISIDNSIQPPSYGIKVDGRERETELDRLRSLDEKTAQQEPKVVEEEARPKPHEQPVREAEPAQEEAPSSTPDPIASPPPAPSASGPASVQEPASVEAPSVKHVPSVAPATQALPQELPPARSNPPLDPAPTKPVPAADPPQVSSTPAAEAGPSKQAPPAGPTSTKPPVEGPAAATPPAPPVPVATVSPPHSVAHSTTGAPQSSSSLTGGSALAAEPASIPAAAASVPLQHTTMPVQLQHPQNPHVAQQQALAMQQQGYPYGYQYPYGYHPQMAGTSYPFQAATVAVAPPPTDNSEPERPKVVARPRDQVVDEKEPKKVIPRVQLDEENPTRVPVPKPAAVESAPEPESVAEEDFAIAPAVAPLADDNEPPLVVATVVPEEAIAKEPNCNPVAEFRVPRQMNTQSEPLPDSDTDDELPMAVAIPVDIEAPGAQDQQEKMLQEPTQADDATVVQPPALAATEQPAAADMKNQESLVAVRPRVEAVDEKAAVVAVPRIQPLDEGPSRLPPVQPSKPKTVQQPAPLPISSATVPPRNVSSASQAPASGPSTVPSKSATVIEYGAYKPPEHPISTKDMVAAENCTRSALQALKFDDISEAVGKLHAALELLGHGDPPLS